MDNVTLAVAGIALLVIGVVGFVAVGLLFVAAVVRYTVVPRLRPLATRFATESRAWLAPPERSRVTLARVPVRPPSRR